MGKNDNIKVGGIQEENFEKLLPILFNDTVFEDKLYISGGYVRDFVMNIISDDIDLTIEEENGSKKLTKYLSNLLNNSVAIKQNNINYPTYNIKFLENISFQELCFNVKDSDIDISDTTKARYPEDSGLKKLYVYGNLQEDCMQRDFTINTLYKNVSNDKIIDFTGLAIRDIENKILRTIPGVNANRLFYNQPKTLLRLCRFFVKYDMTIPNYVIDVASNNAYRIKTLEKDAIVKELKKMNGLEKDKIKYIMKKIDIFYFIKKLFDL